MISPRWRKVLRDLWNFRSRSILVVLAVASGVAAVGIVVSTYIIITSELPADFATVKAANIRMVVDPFNEQMIATVKRVPGVEQVEGRFIQRMRLKIGADTWRDIDLFVYSDYNNIQIDKIFPKRGSWPPVENELLIERSAIGLTRSRLGDQVELIASNGTDQTLQLAGLVHNLNNPSAVFTNRIIGHVTSDTMEKFGYPKAFNELLIRVQDETLERDEIRQIAYDIEDRIQKAGYRVYSITIPNPGQHWFMPYLVPMTSILIILGILILGLSGLLAVNIISALLAQQIRQIGVMKSIGAHTSQLVFMYLIFILIMGIFAFFLAFFLSTSGTRFIINFLSRLINFDVKVSRLPAQAIQIQVLLAVLVPLIAGLFPVISGSRTTVRQAINDYGLSRVQFGTSWFDRVLGYIRGLPRPMLLSLRNTFRRKLRLILTLITLSLGSAIFIAVISVNGALSLTLEAALRYYGFDMVAQLNRPYRSEQILTEVQQVSGIITAETWGSANARVLLEDGTESNNIILAAPPANSELINPTLLEGRWLIPGEENAIVLNSEVLKEDPTIKVGDFINLDIEGTEVNWEVVGIIRSVLSGPTIYTDYASFSRALGRYGLASAVYLKSDSTDATTHRELAKSLEKHFSSVGINVLSTNVVSDLRAIAAQQFRVIILFLMLMTGIFIIVGALGLTGTMSLNVIERRREIGVMRAVGASNWQVLLIVLVEGLVIGLISWMIGALLAVPISVLLRNSVGQGFLNTPLIPYYSVYGSFIWLIIVLGLSMLSSYFPARSASRLTVREVLAYE
jgi:putative ABC transport system permease protein